MKTIAGDDMSSLTVAQIIGIFIVSVMTLVVALAWNDFAVKTLGKMKEGALGYFLYAILLTTSAIIAIYVANKIIR